MKRTNVHLTEKQLKQLRKLAKAMETTSADLIRKAIDHLLLQAAKKAARGASKHAAG